jgi:hypothetical protein
MEEKKYIIFNKEGKEILSLNWLNEQPKEIMYPKLERYIYEKIIYLLLLMKEVDDIKEENDRIDVTSFIEENRSYIEESVILKIKQTFTLDLETIMRIQEKLSHWMSIDWKDIKKDAIIALTNMDISEGLNADLFEKENLDDSFML